MLTNSNNFVINNGIFTEHNTTEGGGLRILRDHSLPKATHDSAAREFALYSIPKTEHKDFVTKFIAWAQTGSKPIMRLRGPKSNLAQLCAEDLKEDLAASFCFSQSQEVDDPSRLFVTLADQLATHIPSYANILDTKLRQNPALVSKSLKVQFRELIAEPIRELLAEGAAFTQQKVIVVEGFDECISAQARYEILSVIHESAGALPFRWAIFSRPDSQLETLLERRGLAMELCWGICHTVPGLPVHDGGFLLRAELVCHEGLVAVRWTLTTYSPRIVTCTDFFFKPLISKSG
ncbi:hypothetical protein P691DRAFT_808643 [Macrolepiota fuliginosa MF-IS2]|uniref:Nephrocystin 3-like N-terminal domain-containing protein n=1 Tax=Macrolepiota fuliginosa MF-IS2 TaxID=1400762 RepID=A0A9P5XGU3_9AGAR|nr:hypothetical protein P691DRAFT_808643 [Macrolepiota fuliginosa MF-IS2]